MPRLASTHPERSTQKRGKGTANGEGINTIPLRVWAYGDSHTHRYTWVLNRALFLQVIRYFTLDFRHKPRRYRHRKYTYLCRYLRTRLNNTIVLLHTFMLEVPQVSYIVTSYLSYRYHVCTYLSTCISIPGVTQARRQPSSRVQVPTCS